MDGHFKPQAEQMRAVEDGSLDTAVGEHPDRLLTADLLVLSFPMWWFSLPAILKGTASGLLNSLRQTGGALAVALFGSLLAGPGGGFSLDGMRIGLLAVGALPSATTALSRILLPRV